MCGPLSHNSLQTPACPILATLATYGEVDHTKWSLVAKWTTQSRAMKARKEEEEEEEDDEEESESSESEEGEEKVPPSSRQTPCTCICAGSLSMV